jgi:hypothetical protein
VRDRIIDLSGLYVYLPIFNFNNWQLYSFYNMHLEEDFP